MIKAYLTKVPLDNFEELYKKVYHTLSKDRKERVDFYNNAKDKALALGAGYLLRYALTEENIFSENLEIIKTERGKPYLKDYNNLFFSISHSGEYVFLCLADGEIGVDVQKIVPVSEKLKSYVLTEREHESLKEEKDFFIFWTIKESYLKLTGEGVAYGLKKVQIDLKKKILSLDGENKNLFIKTFDKENHVFAVVSTLSDSDFYIKEITI